MLFLFRIALKADQTLLQYLGYVKFFYFLHHVHLSELTKTT